MKFLSVCSGIEAASVASNPLGWKAVGFSEIEKFPSAVLKHRYPTTPNHGNSWAAPHARWIGQRINAVEAIHQRMKT